MISKIKNILRNVSKDPKDDYLFKKEILLQTKENLLQTKELEWAHIYHDSIRGKEWLENLPLNVGR